ncbi:hypothetical protein B0H11DRAFT_2204458 [Mycena galericulata]|nr:hypothetical protein B0H11DRAFT_2204458 [Mycena galericulata]
MSVVKRTGGAELHRRKPEPRRRDMRVVGEVQKGSGARPREPELRTGRKVMMEGMLWDDRSMQIVQTGDLENTVISRAKRGKRDLRDLRMWTQVRSIRKKTGGSPVGCSRNTTARKDGGGMGIGNSGGNHVTPDGAGQVPEGVQSDPEDAGSNRREAGGSGQAPLEPNTIRPGRDPSDRKRSGRSAWEPGLICDSAGDSEDARKGTGEAPDEVEGSRPETGKGLSQEPDDWSEE